MDEYQEQYLEDEKNIDEEKELQGLGGWLTLVGIGLFISLFSTIKRIYDLYLFVTGEEWFLLTNVHSEYYHKMWKPGIIFEISVNIILLLILIASIIYFFNKKKAFPKLMIFMYMFVIITAIIDHILIVQIPMLYETDTISFSEIIRASITASIWIPYFIKSKRVNNTFIN
ncbi:DUF2569 domain-containing protein [Oceanirhabdus sp. W0125-5]|uniref:DUF2569 domain-containing protein n=1 Tax=Oceanirhabdus sp. W0125-5 TaxID=2999116 RepID=UPI0022F2C99E|nr:DUF2569 domain-containing protein [Oceanirhabdus sp. W0125-5]WBW94860.1 DUF2569 domain-containing protein [Oceanirhabdus sp. W0125-5]